MCIRCLLRFIASTKNYSRAMCCSPIRTGFKHCQTCRIDLRRFVSSAASKAKCPSFDEFGQEALVRHSRMYITVGREGCTGYKKDFHMNALVLHAFFNTSTILTRRLPFLNKGGHETWKHKSLTSSYATPRCLQQTHKKPALQDKTTLRNRVALQPLYGVLV